MGRPRKPTATLKLQGTYQACRHGERNEPQVDGLPVKPSWLDGEASALWDALVERLGASGVITSADSEMMAAMCRWYQLWREADERIKAGEGIRYKLLVEASMSWNKFAALASSFGLTPADRAKLQTQPKEEKSEFMELLSKSG